MATEVLELEVKTNIQSATQEATALGNSLQRAVTRASALDRELQASGSEGAKELNKADGTADRLQKTLGKVGSESSKLSKGLGKNMGKAGDEAHILTQEIGKSELAVKSTKEETKGLTKALEKSKIAVKGVKEETQELSSKTKNVGDSAKSSGGGVNKLAKGFGNLGKSLGIIALIVAAFTALKEAMERNQKVMDTVNTIMATISTTFNQVIDVLVDTSKWVSKSSENFDGLGKVMSGLLTLAINPFKLGFYQIKLALQVAELAWKSSFLGGGGKDIERITELRIGIAETGEAIAKTAKDTLNAGKDIITNFGDAVGEIGAIGGKVINGISEISIKANNEQAKSMITAQNNAKLAEAGLQGLIEKNDLLAEKQRQIRDDETKTFEQRIAANEELADILNQQETDMLGLADTRVAAAAFELAQNKNNIDLQVAYMQTLNDRAGVEAQVAGFRSEQLTNQVGLEKELGETQKEILAEGLKGMARELQELQSSYELRVEMARRAGMETAAITEQYEQEQDAIRRAYLEPLLELQQENALAEIENLRERALEELTIQQNKDIAAAALMENSEAMLLAIDEKYKRLKGDVNKKADKEEKALAKSKLDFEIGMANQGLQAIASAAGEGTAIAKAAAIAQATISGVQGVQNAFTSANANVGATAGSLGVYPVTMAALAAVFAGMNIAKIASGGGGGASAPPSPPPPSAAPPAPQMMSGEFQLGGGIEPEPLKAFVVTDEMTNSQNQLANIRRQATI